MLKNKILEERRKRVRPEVKRSVDLSFMVVDRIHEILEERGLKQTDLAAMLGKKDSEISKWMRGTHNFTLDTVAAIETALDAPILTVCKPELAEAY